MLAERLGMSALTFPGDHGSFLDSDWGVGDPGPVATALREVLAVAA